MKGMFVTMRKILSSLLTILTLFCFVGCQNKNNNATDGQNPQVNRTSTSISNNPINDNENPTESGAPDNAENQDNPDNPDTPADPNNPDNQNNPDDPNNQNNPDNPDDPNNQDNPDDSNNQDNPDDSNNQDNPDDPNNQDNPDDSNNQDNPDDSNNQDNPDDPNNQDNSANPDDANSGDQAPETIVSEFTTKILTKSKNRATNIRLTCDKINGKTVKAEQEFSFCHTIGTSKESEGYKKADVIIGKRVVQALGGGNCQVSSTLFNAVLSVPELKVTERHPHGKKVNYVPEGKDAAIAHGSKDLKFRNDSNKDLKIYASSDGTQVYVKLVFLG